MTFEGANGLLATSTLRKWLPIASLIGLVAGVGAIVFFAAIQWCTAFFQGTLLGYVAPSPLGEGTAEPVAMLRPWLLPVVVGMGGLLSGLIVFNLAPEAEGHGTDSAIAAYHYHEGFIRPRVPLVKLVASAITIGAGGSAGREGPTAQISAGFGSLLGRWLGLSARDRRIAVAAGIGAGIGAIFPRTARRRRSGGGDPVQGRPRAGSTRAWPDCQHRWLHHFRRLVRLDTDLW